jgi:ATP-dependent DNA helicase PIF1
MIDGKLFDKLEILARIIRGSGKPFGGIQLILCGDFFQLPPVEEKLSNGQKIPITFAFEAEKWDECVNRVVVLKKVFRQKENG